MILGYFPLLYWFPGVELLEKIHLHLKHTLGVLFSKPVGDFLSLVTRRPFFRIVLKHHVISLKDHQRLVLVVICNYSAVCVIPVGGLSDDAARAGPLIQQHSF